MEMYKKPVMNIIEMEKVDVLTASCDCKAGFVDTDRDGMCDSCGGSQPTAQE